MNDPREIRDTVDAMLDQWSVERPDLDHSGMAVVLRILKLSHYLDERLRSSQAPLGLAHWEFDVLSALRRVGTRRGLKPTELCESAHLTSGAMTHRIDGLEKRGLVRRQTEGTDRRSVRVTLTEKGRRLTDRAVAARMEDALESVSALGPESREELADLLRQLLSSHESNHR